MSDQEDNQKALVVAEKMVPQLHALLSEMHSKLIAEGIDEINAQRNMAHFLCLLVGRCGAYQLTAEAKASKVDGVTVNQILAGLTNLQYLNGQSMSQGFMTSLEHEFGLDRPAFDAEANAILLDDMVPTKPDPKDWN